MSKIKVYDNDFDDKDADDDDDDDDDERFGGQCDIDDVMTLIPFISFVFASSSRPTNQPTDQ